MTAIEELSKVQDRIVTQGLEWKRRAESAELDRADLVAALDSMTHAYPIDTQRE